MRAEVKKAQSLQMTAPFFMGGYGSSEGGKVNHLPALATQMPIKAPNQAL
jgi:hypothetical protein